MRFSAIISGALLVLGCLATVAHALTPDQVAVVVNTSSEGSKLVAKHYMAARKIPDANLLEIAVDPMLRGWSEPRYREAVVGPLRKQLRDKHLEDQITCLVLTYDIPLSIPEAGVSEADKAEFGDYEKRLREYAVLLEAGAGKYDAIGAGAPTTAAVTQPGTAAASRALGKIPDANELRQAEEKLVRAADAAVKRIEKLAPDLRGPSMQRFAEVHQEFFGPSGVLSAVTVTDSSPAADETRKRLGQMRDEVTEVNRRIGGLTGSPLNAKTRQELLTLKVRGYGVIGGATQALEWVNRLNPQDSSACLDSELMLLWHDEYPRARFLPNPYCLDNWPINRDKKLPKVMMVARLDGLRAQAVMEMIDTTLKVEKDGLDGVAYFDARGIKAAAYEPYDRDLIETAEYLDKNSTMKVVLEKTEALLQAANCPDAAVYCGWYSLRNYQDSCQWKAGSVAFHVASWEMVTLHDEREKGWVSNLLRRGVCGTLGATEEPFLTAFPKPSQFFPLLLCGDFTQGEVYFVTCPWMSWRIGYVGDPLYNPFKVKPKLASDKVKKNAQLNRAYEIMKSLGMGP